MNFERINGWDNYVIHGVGSVLRIYKTKTKEMKPSKTKDGYMNIGLYKNGKQKFFLIHRLLALHFIPNPENKPCIDHINGVRDDNRLENLRWVTYQENMDGFRSNPAAIITKGNFRKKGNGWQWRYYMSGKQKSKQMKSKDALEKYRKEKLAEYIEC
tara:strand:+ start:22 stop:492 length:471 start_codon:yes stop_codon:yes gene_type:complete